MTQLTPNAVPTLHNRQNPDGFEPWVQVIDLKKIVSASGKGGDRYRLVLSDGQYYMSGMLSTQLSSTLEDGSLAVNYFIRLKDYVGNTVQNRKILIVLGIADIQPGYERVGAPESIDKAGGAPAAAPVTTTHHHAPAPSLYQAPPAPAYQAAAPQSTYLPHQSTAPQAAAPRNPYQKTTTPVKNHAPVVREDPGIRVSDIASLNPYSGGRWTIKARVTARSPVKNWTNARGQGKLCSVDLLDAKGGEIRATLFNDAVDAFYDRLIPNGIFYFSGGKIKMANRKFSAINNDYEVTFDTSSDILTSKAGKQLQKRDFTMVDDTLAEIKVTVWSERATDPACDGWANQVLAIKGCRISDYSGRTLGTFSSTSFVTNPALPEAARLLSWYSAGGASTSTKSLSSGGSGVGGGMGPFDQRSSIADIKDKRLGYGQKPDYITVKGTVSFIKHDTGVWYQACVKCQKKVVPDAAQNFNCEKCQTVYASCENRYILSMVIQDASGSSWTSCFNDQGKIVMQGKSADELAELKDTNMGLFEGSFKQAQFRPYLFRMRCKAEPLNDEVRVKAQIVNLEALNYVTESTELLDAIAKLA
ncbi:hypothetical protein DYB25_000215 [Aphanomyces astaci]|uniref:Replication protein A subunit n=1 Tax=Aphanomyces astaci TaxID=112090 RepID=A0A397BDC6_APHAT|nr:hypothetical protein DYB36_000490 [Aphanomyces astaci]RHY16964.1 hypothetical protein DYB25_000215 [Aphanomyces astaci]RHY60360.1 hypothetical protein DYB38_000181 [Aphanomyces astaci]RHY65138.1 hypothetical protein DYB34_000415 [Aphanomyces astaci]RQM11799.1 hypothetical protein B5M09_001021 [Aphanomyces astaci]